MIILTLFLVFILPQTVIPCSTFMLNKGEVLIVGHNLDEDSLIPGCVVVNKRGITKHGISFEELRTGEKDVSPPLVWTSKYGSITYNPFGRDFPDSGLNEAGLYIGEMTLVETCFPEDEAKPTIFMVLWMQYVLDNFESIDQVIENVNEIMLDGWGWHFFTVDSKGNAAAIEFIDGKTNVYRDKELPVAVLCNSAYPNELKQLVKYNGSEDEKTVFIEDNKTPRFVHASRLIERFSPSKNLPVDYGFDILRAMAGKGNQWSIVSDINNMRIYFNTVKSRKIRYVSFDSFDFSCDTPVKMLDIHANLEGYLKDEFLDYSVELNRKFLTTTIESLTTDKPDLKEYFAPGERTILDLINSMASFPEHVENNK